MPELIIRIRKKTDGSAALTCTRRDGSTTWQRQEGMLGAVFPEHDITHYVVETGLGYRRGFYGLIADGWNITDFATPWPRGPVPDEAREVEFLVGILQTDFRYGEEWTPEQLAEHAKTFARAGGQTEAPRLLTADELRSIREQRAVWIARWHATEPGGALELPFDR